MCNNQEEIQQIMSSLPQPNEQPLDNEIDEPIQALRKKLLSLDVQRQALEQEASIIVAELTSDTITVVVDDTTNNNDNNKNDDAVNGDGRTHKTSPPMGIDTPLVDADGYPRNDIDLYRARTLRGRLAQIRTDHQQLMQTIEVNLQQLALAQSNHNHNHTTPNVVVQRQKEEEEARKAIKPKPKYDPITNKWVVRNWDGTIAGAGKDAQCRSFDNMMENATSITRSSDMIAEDEIRNLTLSNSNTDGPTTTTVVTGRNNTDNRIVYSVATAQSSTFTKPFGRVDSVALASPAAMAGMQIGDTILAFGKETTDLSQVNELVRTAAAEHAILELRIQRMDNNVQVLQLEPRPWNGRGLLGCHIVPM